MLQYVEKITVKPHETGADGLLTVPALCNYMEDGAGAHADLLGCGMEHMLAAGIAWVVAKLRLRLFRMPAAGENILLETWPFGAERLQLRRDYRFSAAGGEVLAACFAQWVVVNAATHRLEKLPADFMRLLPQNTERAVEGGDIRIPSLGGDAAEGPEFRVRLFDVDRNRHLNNVRYAEFALEAADAFGAKGRIAGLDIQFRAEGLHGENLGSRTEEEGKGVLLHSLYRKSNGQELARARTFWDSARREKNV